MKHLINILLILPLCALSCGKAERLPRPTESLFDLEDTLTLGLGKLPGAETAIVSKASGGDNTYANNVLVTFFRGEYYCMWQSSLRDEDTPDTKVLLSRSRDLREWSEPELLARPTDTTFCSPGGWAAGKDSLYAFLNYTCSADRSLGGQAFWISSADGRQWTAPRPVLMEGGDEMDGILEQDPMPLPGGGLVGAAHFRPGLHMAPIRTGDPTGRTGWKRASFASEDLGAQSRELEPSQYLRPDGTLVLLMRDQASSFRKLASLSRDGGRTWTAPRQTDFPDSRSKQCAGNLPDGQAFTIGNPTGSKSRRLLVLALSSDGELFDRAWLLQGRADLPERRHEGRYKTLGYSYPKAAVLGDWLVVGYSINKEDVAVTRIPLLCLMGGLRSGDLVFQANDSNGFVDAIEASTGGSFSHVGIVEADGDGGIWILEATPSRGVTRTPLGDFLEGSAKGPDGRALLRWMRVDDEEAAAGAVALAKTHIGKPYDFAFAPDEEEIYCSELVRDCFLGEDGEPIFSAVAMSFSDSTGRILPFWTEHYRRLGRPVPEGEPGTNPNDLSKEPGLSIIDFGW